jgi:hypothetical protein
MTTPDQTGSSAKSLARRKATYDAGVLAEARTRVAIEADGWTILGQRLRTAAGEVAANAVSGRLGPDVATTGPADSGL